MPVITAASAAARPVEARIDGLSRGQLCGLLAALAAGLVLVWLAVRKAPQGGVRVPARATEDLRPFTPPKGAPVIGVDQHLRGVVYSPHRYPAVCGGDVTALIWYGHRPLLIPHERDFDWLQRPPSEAAL